MRAFNSPSFRWTKISKFPLFEPGSWCMHLRTHVFVEEMQGSGILSISAKIVPCVLRFMLVTVQRESLTEVISFVRLS